MLSGSHGVVWHKGDPRRERLARTLLACAPDDPRHVNNALGLALGGTGTAGNENPRLLETLALAYWRAGKLDNAVEHQRDALSLLADEGPSLTRARVAVDLVLLENAAARSHHREGRVDEAVHVLREGLGSRRRILGDAHPNPFRPESDERVLLPYQLQRSAPAARISSNTSSSMLSNMGMEVPKVDDCDTEDGWTWLEEGVIVTFCGSYCDDLREFRVTRQSPLRPDARRSDVGFRCVYPRDE